MKRSKFLILLLSSLFPIILTGQYSDFDLSRYKLPDIKLNKLDVNFNLTNFVNTDQFKPSYSDSTTSGSNFFLGTLNLDYYHSRNTEKYQGDLEISAYAYRNPDNYKVDNSNSRRNTINENVLIKSTNRFYNQKLNFLEIDPEAFSSKNTYKSYYEYPGNISQRICNDQYTTNLSLPVSIGHGRIEPVEDLRLAIYILEELNKVGRIDSLPSDNVILDMAGEISKIKRQRFFDTRIRKIRELQVIDSFLIANKIVSSNDINYFAVLNDQWDYASGPARSAGFALNAGIDDHIIFNYTSLASSSNGGEPDKSVLAANTYDISGYFQARYYKPINLYWQTSGTFITSYGFEFTRNPKKKNNPEENYKTNIFSTSLGYTIQYLPNSRTSASLNLSCNYTNSRGDRTVPNSNPLVFKMNNNQFTINAGFNMYYYISPQFRIQLNSTLYYSTQNILNTDNYQTEFKSITNSLYHDFELTLIYSFF